MMILPSGIKPANVSPRIVDFGYTVESAAGTDTLRIDRPGNRFELDLTFAPLTGDNARIAVARLNRAQSIGLRIEYPLLNASQGNPGSPVVNGSDSGGMLLRLRGATAGYVFKEGYWLTVISSGGARYLHNVAVQAQVAGDGTVSLVVYPPMRLFPADGNTVLVTAPEVEGFVTNLSGWSIDPDGLVRNLGCTMREAQ